MKGNWRGHLGVVKVSVIGIPIFEMLTSRAAKLASHMMWCPYKRYINFIYYYYYYYNVECTDILAH